MKRAVAKNYSIEKISDEYLTELEKVACDFNPSLFLSEVLRKKNVFFDKGIIEGALNLLESRNYIIHTGMETFYFLITDDDCERLGPSKNSTIEELVEYVKNLSKTLPKGISANIKSYKITGEGARFVRLGQKLDILGVAERKAKREKRQERVITFFIALATAVGIALVTEPVKQFFNKKPQNDTNESSHLRPRFNPR